MFVAISSTMSAQDDFYQLGNGKDYGIAINPVFVLFGWLSGEFNIWNIDRIGEINIPVMFLHNPFYLDEDFYSIDLFSIGAQYRKFFNRKQEGFFVQGGYLFAVADVEGEGDLVGQTVSDSQHAILFGLGYRLISQTNGLFWAIAISAGRAWGTIRDPVGGEIKGSGVAFDADFLKIGYAW
jgi:hypothetical protein